MEKISFLNMEIFNEPDNENFQKNIDKLNKSDYIVISNATGKARGRLSRIKHILNKFHIKVPLHEDWSLIGYQTLPLVDEILYWCKKNSLNDRDDVALFLIDVDVNHRLF